MTTRRRRTIGILLAAAATPALLGLVLTDISMTFQHGVLTITIVFAEAPVEIPQTTTTTSPATDPAPVPPPVW